MTNNERIEEAARELIYADRAVSDFEAKHDISKSLKGTELEEMRTVYRRKTSAINTLVSILRANGMAV